MTEIERMIGCEAVTYIRRQRTLDGITHLPRGQSRIANALVHEAGRLQYRDTLASYDALDRLIPTET